MAEERYCHPRQEGSWSIKKVLPTVASDLHYDALEGVQDGGMAMEAHFGGYGGIDLAASEAGNSRTSPRILQT